ncbi:uncharacterized protein B0I36DRAFT_98868 [Microdochium trichocladiopsis]|uniref:Uncharacterized protein n=1 Tax=Microdochium trichocladiopsis TaxID=1682393 RepID=A0A9P8YAK7_9PEZI|nr:uncharacterized protein B0I36DRAFT_98868 [Microdochium trichocladiopsis]KAH7032573.1 hypothetical protein B0I36DRAFT_98868 [Microdochium trichocladiopsis]
MRATPDPSTSKLPLKSGTRDLRHQQTVTIPNNESPSLARDRNVLRAGKRHEESAEDSSGRTPVRKAKEALHGFLLLLCTLHTMRRSMQVGLAQQSEVQLVAPWSRSMESQYASTEGNGAGDIPRAILASSCPSEGRSAPVRQRGTDTLLPYWIPFYRPTGMARPCPRAFHMNARTLFGGGRPDRGRPGIGVSSVLFLLSDKTESWAGRRTGG